MEKEIDCIPGQSSVMIEGTLFIDDKQATSEDSIVKCQLIVSLEPLIKNPRNDQLEIIQIRNFYIMMMKDSKEEQKVSLSDILLVVCNSTPRKLISSWHNFGKKIRMKVDTWNISNKKFGEFNFEKKIHQHTTLF